MPVGTKLLLLALLPVCCVVALVVVSAVSDFRTASRLSSYRAQARLSFALAPLVVNLGNERRAAVLARLTPGPAAQAQLAAYERGTTQAFDTARATAAHVAASSDVAGGLDAARRQRDALVLQLNAGSLAPAQAIAGYSAITQNVLSLTAALDGGAPSPASARAASAYEPILQTVEADSHERAFVASLLAPRGLRPQPTASPWATLETAELDVFRENASGPLVSDVDAILFSQAGIAVQQFRNQLAANPAAATRATTLQRWLSVSGTRLDALRGIAASAGRNLDTEVTDELDGARAAAARDLTLSLAVLALVTALALALRHSITGPLRDVSAAARGLAHGDITAAVEYASRDEIGDVAAAFRDVHATAAKLIDEIRAKNRAVRENRLEHRVDASGLEGVWSQLVAGLNDTMAAIEELQARRQRAEREAERIFQLSLDLLCVMRFDGYFARVNPAFEQMLGFSRQALLSRPIAEFVHPDDRQTTGARFAALRLGGALGHITNRVVCADGSVRWLEWTARGVPEEGLVYAVGRDITQSRRAAAEQAALRRVATLVARGVAPEAVFAAVAEEVAGVFAGVDLALVGRYRSDHAVEYVGGWSSGGERDWLGRVVAVGGRNVTTQVFERGQPARVENLGEDGGAASDLARSLGCRSSAGAPISIEGQLWGVMIVASVGEGVLAEGIEHDLAAFIELIATAIANTQAREELAASRARLVTASDEARRRIERDLHDGVQQRLVVLGLQLQAARETAAGSAKLDEQLTEIARGLTGVLDDLRQISSGIHPAILRHGGLRAALRALSRRSPIPVQLDVPVGLDLPDAVEVAAYYVVAEALTNAAKHSGASSVEVRVAAHEQRLEVTIRDDGRGGATLGAGSGLIGLTDRVQAIGGRVRITSPPGQGTMLQVGLPFAQIPLQPVLERA